MCQNEVAIESTPASSAKIMQVCMAVSSERVTDYGRVWKSENVSLNSHVYIHMYPDV